MRAIWITKLGGPEVLQVREGPDPAPGPGEVRIRVQASGLNFADILARVGLYPAAPKPPCVVGYEVAGVVDQVGAAVTSLRAGARVLALTHFGGHADVVCVPADALVMLPDTVSFETAAALPVNYLTAYHMVTRSAWLRPGDSVVVHMAAGGVGLALLNLCRRIGGITLFGTSSASKHGVLREHGCAHPIDYRTADYAAEVKRLTNGQGVDAVFDPLGGRDWRRGYSLLKPGGRLVAYGFANLQSGGKRSLLRILPQLLAMPRFSPLQLLSGGRTVAGVSLSAAWGAPLRQDLEEIVGMAARGEVKPVIDSVFEFNRVADACHRLEARLNVGKVLLKP